MMFLSFRDIELIFWICVLGKVSKTIYFHKLVIRGQWTVDWSRAHNNTFFNILNGKINSNGYLCQIERRSITMQPKTF